MSLRSTGKKPSGTFRERIVASPNYREGAFQNLSPTPMKQDDVSYWTMTRKFLKKYPAVTPPYVLPSHKTDLHNLPGQGPVLTWFGHSSYLLKMDGRTILVDPVLSGHAAPVSFMVKAFAGSDVYKAADMPAIDYLVITHDHYDHLDFKTMVSLRSKVKKVICSLGVGSHLRYWGFDTNNITELDWWESCEPEAGVTFTCTPARHFSGRGLKRGQTLWSAFVLQTATHRIFLGGDSGYDTHFKMIGERMGPFDLVILEAGQYNAMWPLIHMMPEETVQAAMELKAAMLLPVHWGKFKLSMHPWDEPIRRILTHAEVVNKGASTPIKILAPMIGEPVELDRPPAFSAWWEMGDTGKVTIN